MSVADKKFKDFIKQVSSGNFYREDFKNAVRDFVSFEKNMNFLLNTSYPLSNRLFLFIVGGKKVPVKIFEELKESENCTQEVYNACMILNTLRLLADNDMYEHVTVYFRNGKDFEKIHQNGKLAFHEFKMEEMKFRNNFTWREDRKVPDVSEEVKTKYEEMNIQNIAYKKILFKLFHKKQYGKICLNHDIFIDFADKNLRKYCEFLFSKGINFVVEEDGSNLEKDKDRKEQILEKVAEKREKYTESLQEEAKDFLAEYKDIEKFKDVIKVLENAGLDYVISSEWETNSVYNLMCDVGLEYAVNRLITLDMYDEEISFCASDYYISFGLKEEEGSFSKEELNIFIEFLREKKYCESSGEKKIKL